MTNLTGKWHKHDVQCSYCTKAISRRLYRPKDGASILQFFCDHTCKGSWQRSQKPQSEEWLRRRYLVDRASANEIAREVGRDPKRVWEWLRDYGIPIRPRGTDYGQAFKAGEPSAFLGKSHTPETRAKIRQRSIADGRVPYLKDGKHHLAGKSGADTPNWRGGRTPERQGFYSSQAWKDACVAVWHRADAKCERCGLDHRTIDRSVKAFHVHHIVSFQVCLLRAEPSNLALLCDTCHRWVHGKNNINRLFLEEPNGRS